MRTGAIFARGSCRALKWMALFGVVFALGAGSAAAQAATVTFTVAEKVGEGDRVMVTLGGTVGLDANATDSATTATVTVTASADTRTPTAAEIAAGVTAGEATGIVDSAGFDPAALVISIPRAANAPAVTAHPVSGTIYWSVGSDPDAEDEAMTLSVALTAASGLTPGGDPAGKPVVIEDDETQMFVWSSTALEMKEGGTEMVTLTARPTPVDRTYGATLAVDSLGYTLDTYSAVFSAVADTPTGSVGPSLNITVQAPGNDRNRVEDTIKLEVTETGKVTKLADDLSIKVEDIHGLPETSDITAVAYDAMTGGNRVTSPVEEGGVVYLEVVADRGTDGYPMGEAIEVALSLSDSSLAEFETDKDTATVPTGTGEKKAPRVKLTTKAMDSFPQAGTLVVSLEASGANAANGTETVSGTPLTLAITDSTVRQVFVKDGAMEHIYGRRDAAKGSDGMLNPGDDFTVDNDMLFGTAEGYTFQLDARSSGAEVSVDDSGDVMIMPESAGTAMITLTATALPAASSFRGTQRSESVAIIEFEVEVVDAAVVPPGMPQNLTATAGDGRVMLSWEAPSSGATPTGYEFRSEVDNRWSDWAPTSSMTEHTVTGLTNGKEHTFEVWAVAGEVKGEAASTTATPRAAPTPTLRGQITDFRLIGDVRDKTIAGIERHHVPEGSQTVRLQVKVTWTHREIEEIGYNRTQYVRVLIRSGRGTIALPKWVSWVDGGSDVGSQDVHFPRTSGEDYGWVYFRTPRREQIPEIEQGNPRLIYETTGTLPVLILHDDEEAENDAFYIEAVDGNVNLGPQAGRSYTNRTIEVVIEDDEDQKVRVRNSHYSPGPTNAYEPAGDPEITNPRFIVDAEPNRRDLPLEVRLDMVDLNDQTVSAAKISLSKASMTLNEGDIGDSDWVTVHLPDSDGNRMDDPYKLNASVNVYSVATGGYRTIPVAEHEITVVDRHKLPKLLASPSTAMVKEGDTTELTLTINRNPGNTIVGTAAVNSERKEKREYTDEEVSIMLTEGAGSTAGASDWSAMPNPVVFPKHERGSYTTSMTVEVKAEPDNDLDDGEMLVLDAMVSGNETENGTDKDMNAGVSSLTIGEGTGRLVWARTPEEVEAAVMAAKKDGMGDDMMFTAGEMIELEGNDLFGSAEGVSVGYTAMVEGDAVSYTESGGVVTITAEKMGMAKVTITARASRPSGAVTINDQTDPREASITIALEVGLVALSVMLSGPDDMNLVEGGMGGMVTATANRAVTEDTVVNLMRDRAMSSADDADFTAEPITIMAGQMKGSTMVMAVEDNMMENEGNMAEELVLYGMAADNAGEVTGHVKFYLWDAAVPALPVIAQLLLAAFLAFGGYRRYRRR